MDRLTVAIHEAGHVAVALALGIEVTSVSLGVSQRTGRTRTGGEGQAATERDLRLGAVVAMGGLAAEEALCGVATVGSAHDVHGATELLITRIEAGLDPEFPPISRRAWGGSWTPKAIDELIGPRVMELLASAREDAGRSSRYAPTESGGSPRRSCSSPSSPVHDLGRPGRSQWPVHPRSRPTGPAT